ncbi:hypothetical protein KY285_032811 [Solanum tuberosum]|nr:hypothetical protein KY285_032811 [Solanum tuberosum]
MDRSGEPSFELLGPKSWLPNLQWVSTVCRLVEGLAVPTVDTLVTNKFLIEHSSGSEYEPEHTRGSLIAPLTTRHRSRQVVVFDEENSQSHEIYQQSEEVAQPSHMENRESQSSSNFGSNSDSVVASALNATSSSEAYNPLDLIYELIHLSTEPNRWTIKGMFHIYIDGL